MSREEAIEVLKDLWRYEHSEFSEKDIREALDMAIRALKNEQTCNDSDLISRELAKKMIRDRFKDLSERVEINTVLNEVPSAEKKAEWIKQKSGDELFPEEIVCSKCYHSNSHLDFDEHNNPIGKVFLESKYCPNCGARMKGVEE